MDQGFNSMLPRPKEVKQKDLYDYSIKFSLFGKQFQFIIKVQENQRTK